MASFKFTEIPPFTKREGDALLFNEDGVLEYYVPEDYSGSGKSSSLIIEGAYIKLIGSFNYRLIDAKGNLGKLMIFNFPTMFICRPGAIEDRKNISLDKGLDPANYKVLIFEKGDQLVTRCHVDQNIDNLSELFRLHIRTGRIPNNIPYNTLYTYPLECMALNSKTYGVHSQAMGLLYSKICRDPDDINKPFRLSNKIKTQMTGYGTVSIKEAAKLISPFVSITSENMDESVISSILLANDEKTGKIKHKESPMEKVMTM